MKTIWSATSRPRSLWTSPGVRWLELFHPFISMKTLRVSSQISESIARAFEELTVGTITRVLPALESLDLGTTPS